MRRTIFLPLTRSRAIINCVPLDVPRLRVVLLLGNINLLDFNKMRSLYAFLAFSLHTCVQSRPFSVPDQVPITGTIPFTFRNATLDDIDDITTVFLDAFRPSSSWSYIHQFEDDVDPEYTWTCQRHAFEKFYQMTGAVDIKVISVADEAAARNEKVVSFSAWDLRRLNITSEKPQVVLSTPILWPASGVFPRAITTGEPSSMSFDCETHLDVNMTRLRHVNTSMAGHDDKYLKILGPQLYLGLLATHPDWDGNGFASRHLSWGKKKLSKLNHASEGSDHRMPLTLTGTPAGYPLYIKEGFKGLHNTSFERLDGKGTIWYEAMKYETD